MDRYGQELADGIEACLPHWVERCVRDVMAAWQGDVTPAVAEASRMAGRTAAREVGAQVRRLLEADVDDQRTTPLQLVRAAVRYPTAVLADAGAPPVQRDAFTTRAFPADLYDLSPASWAEVDPALTDLGIAWGAAKAFVHMQRHRSGS
jgi:hypothetical protein